MSENPFLSNHEAVCPDNLLKLAREHSPARTAIVRAGSALPMQAAKAAVDEGIMEPVFVGEKDEIEREAEALSWDISGFETVANNRGKGSCGCRRPARQSPRGRRHHERQSSHGCIHGRAYPKGYRHSNFEPAGACVLHY